MEDWVTGANVAWAMTSMLMESVVWVKEQFYYYYFANYTELPKDITHLHRNQHWFHAI